MKKYQENLKRFKVKFKNDYCDWSTVFKTEYWHANCHTLKGYRESEGEEVRVFVDVIAYDIKDVLGVSKIVWIIWLWLDQAKGKNVF